jgi:ATP-binding cassette subfamily B protein
MSVEREAFIRAWRFLSYQPVAKWTAMTAAVITGILYVALLVVLCLFTDLLVNRGQIPTYQAMSPAEREEFQTVWSKPPEDASSEQGPQIIKDRNKEALQVLGLPAKTTDRLAAEPLDKLPPAYQELAWRSHLYQILSTRVSRSAAVLVLPDYRELPDTVKTDVGEWWRSLSISARQDELKVLKVLEDSRASSLAEADLSKLSPKDQELVWRAHLWSQLDNVPDSQARDTFWQDRQDRGGDGRDVSWELADRGILSLIARTYDRPFSSPYNWVLGKLAYFNPWMWRTGGASRPNFQDYLTGLLAIAVLLALLRALAMYVMHYSAALATIEASNRLRRAVYHHTFRLGTLAFRALGPSEAVGVFTRHLEAVHDGLYTWLTVVYREPVKFGLVLAFALVLNVWLTLAFLLFAVLVWIIGGQIAVYFRRQEREAVRVAANHLALLQESLMLMRLVKCYLMELFNQSRVERQLTQYADAQLRRYQGEAIYRPVLFFLGTLAALVLLYVAGLIVLHQRLGVARGIVLATALVSLYWPVVNWLANRRYVRRSRQAAESLFEFLDRPHEVGQVVGAEFLPPLRQTLEFVNVSLKEPGTGRPLLEGVTLTIEAGQRVGIVGPDDMEKHALVYLIPRFLDPHAGEIRIDQHNLRWVTFDSLRAQIAMVLQHNLVFNDTVANNIGCGDPSYDLPKIIQAAKVAHAHQFIQKLPKGYETPIGEMGHYLNVGEQFRIALARALLRDPALFIIEEPAALLDDDTKALIDDTLARVLPDRTVIFLPHRMSTIRSCHRVFLLHQGRVEAAGDHREMLTQSELYRHLQYLEFNVFSDQLTR